MCLQLLRTKLCFSKRQFRFRQSTTNRYRSIPIYTSIGIDNRYQSIATQIFAIDWSSIININRLIDIDWYRLISTIIDYRFHRLDSPGVQIHLAQLKWREVIPWRSLRNLYVAKFDDPVTDGCQGTKDFLA